MFIKFILYNPLLKKCLYDKHARYSLAMCNFDGWNLCGCAIFLVSETFPSIQWRSFSDKTFFLKQYRIIFKKHVLLSKKGQLKHLFCEWFFLQMKCDAFPKENARTFPKKTRYYFFLSTGSLLYALYFKYNIAVSFFFYKHIISSNRCMFRYRIIIRLQSFV